MFCSGWLHSKKILGNPVETPWKPAIVNQKESFNFDSIVSGGSFFVMFQENSSKLRGKNSVTGKMKT